MEQTLPSYRSIERIRLATRRPIFLLCLQQMGFSEYGVGSRRVSDCRLRKYPSVLRPPVSLAHRLKRVA